MKGIQKAFLKIKGKRIIDSKIEALKKYFSKIIIVTNKPKDFSHLKNSYLKIIQDLQKNKGPLMGIYSGLKKSTHQINFITASDMPFVNLKLLCYMLSEAKGFDAVVPESAKGLEPLFAIYKKSTIPIIKELLEEGKYRPRKIFEKVNTLIIKKNKVCQFDPEEISFLNINDQKDYQ